MSQQEDSPKLSNFIADVVVADLESNRDEGRVHTRFPPEPNGYLHVGHAKSICLNFGLAARFGGKCNLRFDDTNPEKEDAEYEGAIMEDVRWLGFSWDGLFHASDYFEQLHDLAVGLIRAGKAYVDSQSAEAIRESRGTLTEPGRESPYRERSVEENLDLFARMRAGEFADGEQVLRAKIDMAAPNINLRDPVIYRVRHAKHHRTGDAWCIYPMYDFTHALSDALEGITHSVCTLEFEDHRPLYDWCVRESAVDHTPRQYEFARLELTYTLTSKRKLLTLVREGHVSGWDDPRMPTIIGMRRRGYPAAALRLFCERIGVTKKNSVIDVGALETCVREVLDGSAERRMAVMNPLKLTLTNYPESEVEWMTAANHPKDPGLGSREIPFSRTLYIERDDFMLDPPKKFHRLGPGREVRLRYGYIIRCDDVVTDAEGNVTELLCSYDPETRSGDAPDGRKVKGTIHWVSAAHAHDAQVRLYDRLFNVPAPGAEEDVHAALNPDSLSTITAKVEPALASTAPETVVQFERTGYFCADRHEHSDAAPVFNRTVTLRDSWGKVAGS